MKDCVIYIDCTAAEGGPCGFFRKTDDHFEFDCEGLATATRMTGPEALEQKWKMEQDFPGEGAVTILRVLTPDNLSASRPKV